MFMKAITGIILVSLLEVNYAILEHYFNNKWGTFDPVVTEFMEEVHMDASEVISSCGYASEKHVVATGDGYYITVHRIPQNKNKTSANGIPVLLMHGIFGISHNWIYDPNISLAFRLADEGYDVWMGNWRGNRYTNHKVFSRKSKKFWQFSLDDVAEYDLPAMINYILAITKYNKLFYIGYSLGTSIGFMTLSSQPQMNDKVAGFFALAPVGQISYTTTITMKPALLAVAAYISKILDNTGWHEFYLVPPSLYKLVPLLCPSKNPILCSTAAFLLGGYNPYLVNMTRMPLFAILQAQVESARVIDQMRQVRLNDNVSRYDYGEERNKIMYHSIKPPAYYPAGITVPVIMYYGANDAIADPLDVYITSTKLNNLVTMKLVDSPMFTHMDFLWAKNVKELIHDDLIKYLKQLWS